MTKNLKLVNKDATTEAPVMNQRVVLYRSDFDYDAEQSVERVVETYENVDGYSLSKEFLAIIQGPKTTVLLVERFSKIELFKE